MTNHTGSKWIMVFVFIVGCGFPDTDLENPLNATLDSAFHIDAPTQMSASGKHIELIQIFLPKASFNDSVTLEISDDKGVIIPWDLKEEPKLKEKKIAALIHKSASPITIKPSIAIGDSVVAGAILVSRLKSGQSTLSATINDQKIKKQIHFNTVPPDSVFNLQMRSNISANGVDTIHIGIKIPRILGMQTLKLNTKNGQFYEPTYISGQENDTDKAGLASMTLDLTPTELQDTDYLTEVIFKAGKTPGTAIIEATVDGIVNRQTLQVNPVYATSIQDSSIEQRIAGRDSTLKVDFIRTVIAVKLDNQASSGTKVKFRIPDTDITANQVRLFQYTEAVGQSLVFENGEPREIIAESDDKGIARIFYQHNLIAETPQNQTEKKIWISYETHKDIFRPETPFLFFSYE